MIQPTLEAWFLDEARESYGRPAVGEAYSDGGLRAVAELVLEEASRRIDYETDTGETAIHAFNRVTGEWPHQARAELAGYEYRERDREEHEQYYEEIQEFVEMEGIEDESGIQTTVDSFLQANPYDNSDLTQEQADVVMLLRACDEDFDEDIIDEINSASNFIESYYDIGNVEAAIDRHVFDAEIPDEALEQLAPASEWPDDLDPTDTEEFMCAMCGHLYREVFLSEGDYGWINRSGSIDEGVRLQEIDAITHPDNGEYLCDSCYSRYTEQRNDVALSDGERYYNLRGYGDIFEVGDGSDVPTDQVSHILEIAANISATSPMDGHYYELVPEDIVTASGRTLMDAARSSLEQLSHEDDTFAGAINGNYNFHIVMPEDSHEVVRQFKHHFADEVNNV